eukprot:gene29135-35164_t
MEKDPLIELTAFFESKGFASKEAVEEAKVELDKRRQQERELRQQPT